MNTNIGGSLPALELGCQRPCLTCPMAILMFAALNRPVPSDEIESRAGGQFTAAAT
jgi:hypothetical protein